MDICSEKFGIRPNHAIDAIRNHDSVEVVKADGLELRIHLKWVSLARPPMHLIITENIHNRLHRIDFGLKVYPDLCDSLETKSPLELIQIVANRFGVNIQVGQKRAKFILQEKIPIKGRQNLFIAENPENHFIVQQLYVKIESGPPAIANCALCYCLDATEYISWLKRK